MPTSIWPSARSSVTLVLFAAGVATEAKVPVDVVDEIPTTLSVSFFCCSW